MTSKLTAKDKSIILQVIFKEVYEEGKDPSLVKGDLATYADMLFAAHDHYGAGGADEQRRGGGGGGQRSSGGGGGGGFGKPKYDKSTLPLVSVDYFGNGKPIQFYDQRPAKEAGAYADRAPDYQSVNKFDLGDGRGEQNIPLWLTDAQGNPNQDTLALVGGGDTPDTAPF